MREGLVLAGIGDRVGGPYTVNFYPAEIITPASEATKNEALVRTARAVDSYHKQEEWTALIAKTRPLLKEDLKLGLLVLASGDTQARSPEDLASFQDWWLFRVKDIANIRIILNDLPLNLEDLPN